MIAGAGDVELIGDAGAERRDHRLDLLVGEDVVEPRFFHIDDLAPERQDGLEGAVTRLLGRAAGAIALNQVDLAGGRILDRAVSELSGEGAVFQSTLAPGEVTRLAGSRPRPGRRRGLGHYLLGLAGMLLQELGELGPHGALDETTYLGVAQLGLGLTLELGLAQFDRDDRREALTDIVAGKRLFFLLEQPLAAGVIVDDAGECRAKT